MPKKDTISHDGQVVEVLQDKYKIKIITKSACSSCHAKGVCNPSDQAEKIIDAISVQKLELYDSVIVELEERLGWKALFYGIIIPFVIMVSILFFLSTRTDELSSALFALGSLVPYYFTIFLLRQRIEKEFIFTAKKDTKRFNKLNLTQVDTQFGLE